MARVRRQAAEWAALIEQWRQSGLSLPEFCQQHGLSRGSMQNWVYKPKLKRAVEAARREAQGPVGETRATLATSVFVPVRVVEDAVGDHVPGRSGVEIVTTEGRRITVGAGFDAETLRRVVAVLEGRMC